MISAAEFLKWCSVFKITTGGGGGGVTSTQVQRQTFNTSADTGTANTYVGTISPVPSTLTQSLPVLLTVANTNTGASTFNLNALGSNPIVNLDGSALAGGELDAGSNAFLLYSTTNTNWVLLNSALSGGVFNFATKAQVQQSSYNVGVDSGVADAYVVALTPPSVSLTDGLSVEFAPLHTNLTATPTVNVDGHGVKDIVLINGDPLIAADMPSGLNRTMLFDTTANVFFLQNPALSYTTARDVQTVAYNTAADAGSVNAYGMSIDPSPPGTLTDAFPVWITDILHTNTGAATFALNGGSALAIVNLAGSALTGGELVLHHDVHLVYNLTNNNWVLQNSATLGSGGGVTALQIQEQAFTYSTDTGADGTHYIGTYSPSLGSAPTDGTIVGLIAAHTTGGGGATFNAGFGANIIVLNDGTYSVVAPLDSIIAGGYYQFEWNNANSRWVLLNPSIAPFFQYNLNTFVVDGGTPNNYSGNTTPVSSTQLNSQVWLHPANSNTGASTFTLAGLSKSIVALDGSALVGGEIVAGYPANLVYNNTAWVLQNSALGVVSGLATIDGVQYQSYNYAQDTGAVNAYVAALTPPLFAGLSNGLPVSIDITNGNTGACTLNVDGTGAKPILNLQGNPLSGGEMIGGFVYDFKSSGGANWILQNSSLASGGGGVTSAQVQQSTFSHATDTGAVNAYIGVFSPAISTTLPSGTIVILDILTVTNTGASTFDAGFGASGITTSNGSALVGGEMTGGSSYALLWNFDFGTWTLLNSSASVVTPFDIQRQSYSVGADSGSVNTYQITLSPAPISVNYSGFKVGFYAANTNTGTSTLDINSIGANTLALEGGGALSAGNIVAGNYYEAVFETGSSIWILLNPTLSSGGGVTSAQLQSGQFVLGVDSGAADAYVVALTPPSAALTDGMLVYFQPLNANVTFTPTIDLDGHGALPITLGSEDVSPHDINAAISGTYLQYDLPTTTWILLNPCVSYVTVGNLSQYTYSPDAGAVNAYVGTSYLALNNVTPVDGQYLTLGNISATNTGATTFNAGFLGSIPVLDNKTKAALVGGEIIIGTVAEFQYSSTLSSWMLMNSAASSGGGGSTTPLLANINNVYEWNEEMLSSTVLGGSNGGSAGSGGAQSFTNFATSGAGIMELSVNTNNNAHYLFHFPGTGGNTLNITEANTIWTCQSRVMILDDFSTGDTCKFRVGFAAGSAFDPDSTASNDICMVLETGLNSFAWTGQSTSAGVGQTRTTATSPVVAINVWHDVKVVMNNVTNAAHFYVDGTEISGSPITTNIPPSSYAGCIATDILAGATSVTARRVLVDYVYYGVQFSPAR